MKHLGIRMVSFESYQLFPGKKKRGMKMDEIHNAAIQREDYSSTLPVA